MVHKPNELPQDPAGPSLQNRECLIVMLEPQLVLAKVRPWPVKSFICDSRHYEDAGFGEWTQFYDWLRVSKNHVIGVRYWLDTETQFLADYAKQLPYVRVDGSRNLEIFFSKQRAVNQSISCDQDFLYDAIFRTAEGQYAILFGLEGLNGTELDRLENGGVSWTEAHLIGRKGDAET